jgi:hypothetical protein
MVSGEGREALEDKRPDVDDATAEAEFVRKAIGSRQ